MYNQIIELTNKLYKLTLLFPKKEPLRNKMRELADDILADFIALNIEIGGNPKNNDLNFNIRKNIEILKSYFEIAKWQNWVSYFDVLNLEEKYDKIYNKLSVQQIKEEVKEEAKDVITLIEPSSSFKNVNVGQFLDSRKEKILKLLKERGKLQVGEVSSILSDVSKRTLRRDFVQLLEMDLIERIGESNETFYQLKTDRG